MVVPETASNLAFDESLRSQNAAWVLRRLEDVCEVAEQFGFRLQERHFMPANNLSPFFQRQLVPPRLYVLNSARNVPRGIFALLPPG